MASNHSLGICVRQGEFHYLDPKAMDTRSGNSINPTKSLLSRIEFWRIVVDEVPRDITLWILLLRACIVFFPCAGAVR